MSLTDTIRDLEQQKSRLETALEALYDVQSETNPTARTSLPQVPRPTKRVGTLTKRALTPLEKAEKSRKMRESWARRRAANLPAQEEIAATSEPTNQYAQELASAVAHEEQPATVQEEPIPVVTVPDDPDSAVKQVGKPAKRKTHVN